MDGKSFHEPVHLLASEGFDLLFIAWPGQFPILKAFVKQPKSLTVPVKSLESIFSATAEKKDLAWEGIEVELTFDKIGEWINSLTHIRFPADQVDLS